MAPEPVNLASYGYTKHQSNLPTLGSLEFYQKTFNPAQFREMHYLVESSRTFNFLSSRVTVNSHLNLQLWHSLLTHYNDIQIVQFLAFGFPLALRVTTVVDVRTMYVL